MTELINKFIGNKCIISTDDDSAFRGIIHSCNEGWIEVEDKGRCRIVNCQHIIAISDDV